MEQYNYYPGQPGHPPPPNVNHQPGGPPLQQQQHPINAQVMHGPPMQPQNIRQAMPQGPPGQHQQMQQQYLGHQPHLPPQQQQQQQHPNFHQIQPPHGQPVSHSGSPHSQQHQHTQQHHNHQGGQMTGPPPHPHHIHPQSPHHHHPGQSMHMPPQQQLNHSIVRPNMGPTNINHSQPGLQQAPPHHPQNFFGGNPNMQPNMHQHFNQQNHNPHPHHHHPMPHHQPPQHHHPQSMMHHGPNMIPHQSQFHQQPFGRSSPYYQSILPTENRIFELNRRLQLRPNCGQPLTPLPNNYSDESLWWERFASDFFDDDASLTIRVQEDKPIDFTIGRKLIPGFFKNYFRGGVTDLAIQLRKPRELFPQANSIITLDCDQAIVVTNHNIRHTNITYGVVVHTEGHISIDFYNNEMDQLQIREWRFFTKACREYVDRSVATNYPNSLHIDPITRQGLTKSLVSYLRMCMSLEPMQEIMSQHKVTPQMPPRECLKKLLVDKYKYRGTEDGRNAPNKRRKRKPSAAPAGGAATNKRSKANNNQNNNNNNNAIIANNRVPSNMIMSPSGTPNLTLASRDVMIVGEPSMMGGDFGDDNERMITRLENTQYDPASTSNPSNAEESNSLTMTSGAVVNSNPVEPSMDSSHNMSPSLLQHRQQNQQPQQLEQTDLAQPSQNQQTGSMNQAAEQPPEFQIQSDQKEIQIDTQQMQEQIQQQVTSQIETKIDTIDDKQEMLQPLEDEKQIHKQTQQDEHPKQTVSQDDTSVAQQDSQQTSEDVKQEDQNDQSQVDQQPDQEHLFDSAVEVVKLDLDLENQENHQQQEPQQQEPSPPPEASDENVAASLSEQIDIKDSEIKLESNTDTTVSDTSNAISMLGGINSVEQMENHNNNSIQPLNEESNSNSQLPCSTASAPSSIKQQQQPVDNGVA